MNINNFQLPKAISNQLLEITANLSDKNLLKALGILEKFASIKWQLKGFSGIKQMIQERHPGIEAVRRILRNANPAARSAILNNFALGCILFGYRKRLDFYNKHNVAPLATLMISPTLRCNMTCYGCYAGTHEHRQELSFEEVDQVVAGSTDAGTNFIIILGGEPFILPWLLDLLEKYPSAAFQIFTNGLLIDDEKVERLAAMGNVAITIGVDGHRDQTDDRRGTGTYDKATAIMRKLSNAGVVVGFSAMLSTRNFKTIYSDEFLGAMIENGAGYGWIPVALPQGRACSDKDLILSQEQKKQIEVLANDARNRMPILLVDFYNDSRLTEGCGAGRITAHVNANGDVEPCVLMPFAKDNIREKPFVDILRSGFFEGLRDINHRFCKESQTCMWVYKPKEVLNVINTCGAKSTSEGVLDRLNALAKNQE